jgi:predicted ABC-type ATPase
MFAGPNGSGKSTMKDMLPLQWLGHYVNADEFEKVIQEKGCFDFSAYGLSADEIDLFEFFAKSTLLADAKLVGLTKRFTLVKNSLEFDGVAINSYFASVLADFVRQALIKARESLTFETVMSSPDKVSFLLNAKEAGYRTYLYYVATENPEINVSRVRHRVRTGGHDVPEDKIRTRYARSLELLSAAIAASNRAFIFDNSTNQRRLIAEITDGQQMEYKTKLIPAWFSKAVTILE